jgi:hypothetical protein
LFVFTGHSPGRWWTTVDRSYAALIKPSEHELEVGDDGLRAARAAREPGQRGSPEVVRHPEARAGGRVQLGTPT